MTKIIALRLFSMEQTIGIISNCFPKWGCFDCISLMHFVKFYFHDLF